MKFKIHKITTLLIVTFVITTSACGQQRGREQKPPQLPSTKQIEEMVSDLADEILLSENQEEQILKLYKSHFKEIESKTKSGRPNKSEMEDLKNDFEADVKANLTVDQVKLYETYLKNNSRKSRPQRQ
jgi:hypothetical protein